MPTTAPPLPCLKEFKWPGHTDTVCRPLWDKDDSSSPYMPWVALGYDHPHSFEFIGTKSLTELNTTAQDLETEALAALRARPAKWEPVDVDAKGKSLRILTCAGDFFSAEQILNTSFMQEAQRMVKAPGLFVGVPRRGLLMATAANQENELITAFGAAVAGQFSRGESALISPMLFAMKDGAIIGTFDAVAKLAVPDGEPRGALGEDEGEPGDDSNAPFVSAMVSRNKQGSEDVHLLVGGDNPDTLAKTIEAGFMTLLKEHAPRKEFSGHIEIVVLGMTPPAARKHIPRLLEHLKGICNEMSRGKEQRYRVSVTYQKDSLQSPGGAPPAKSAPAKASPFAGRPAARSSTRPAAPITAAPERRKIFTTSRVIVMILGAVGGIYGLYRSESLPSYPSAIAYDGASLIQATKWERDRTAAAVYIPAGEAMPGASLQLGIISSKQHASAGALLRWITTQSRASTTTQRFHDDVEGNERCLAGIGAERPFLALQLCKSGKDVAACIESDRQVEVKVLVSCQNKFTCFVSMCEEKWSEERDGMNRVLTSFLSP